jgi:hypothetical protein
MRASPVLSALPFLVLASACSPGYEVAQKGRQFVTGMDVTTLQSCAGIPTRTKRLDARTELYSYEIHYERTGGVQINLPIIAGGFSAGGSGNYCHALVRVVGGRVEGVTYTGDNDEMLGKDGVCAPIFRGCLREYEKSPEVASTGRSANR